MTTFTEVIGIYPPALWEQNGLKSQTLMLLLVSKQMVAAVFHAGRDALPAQIAVKPSQVNPFGLGKIRVKLMVQFLPETDATEYLRSARNVNGALKYLQNATTLDFSALKVIGADEHRTDEDGIDEDDEAYWTTEDADQFVDELTQNCTCLEELLLSDAMIKVVTCGWDDWEYWLWLSQLPKLHTLSLIGMGIDSDIAYDVLTVVMKCTTLTELNMDHSPIENLNNILTAYPPDNLNLRSLSLSGCGLGGWDDTDEDMQSVSAKGVRRLLTAVTSLTELDLGGNMYGDMQGTAIADALPTTTSLQKLDLTFNHMSLAVHEQIRAAWQPRKQGNLKLDQDSSME
jgi:hypothetical protein